MHRNLINILKASKFEEGSETNLQGDFDYLRFLKEFSSLSFDDLCKVFLSYLKVIHEFNLADFHSQNKNGKEIKWEKDIDVFIDDLNNFIKQNYSKLKQEAAYFFDFDYCYILWKKNYQDMDWSQFEKSA